VLIISLPFVVLFIFSRYRILSKRLSFSYPNFVLLNNMISFSLIIILNFIIYSALMIAIVLFLNFLPFYLLPILYRQYEFIHWYWIEIIFDIKHLYENH